MVVSRLSIRTFSLIVWIKVRLSIVPQSIENSIEPFSLSKASGNEYLQSKASFVLKQGIGSGMDRLSENTGAVFYANNYAGVTALKLTFKTRLQSDFRVKVNAQKLKTEVFPSKAWSCNSIKKPQFLLLIE